MNAHFSRLIFVLCCSALVFGCGGGKLDSDSSSETAAATGNAAGSNLGSDGPTDDHALPLKTTGLNSVEEFNRGVAATQNPEAAEAFAEGYRKTFTADATKRDYVAAVTHLEHALVIDSTYAEAHRALGYARFNLGFDVDAALRHYKRAVELKPDYGEAHYALAFMYAMGNKELGEVHFTKAMKLGIPDERRLGEQYYPGQP